MRHLLFSIDRLEFSGGGRALVCGRNCGDNLKTGDRVTAMVRMADSYDVKQVLETEPIAFTMPLFLVWSVEMDTLEAGYSAGIYLDARVATGLRLGWFLVGENEG
jgi:hypothetical protein